METVRRAVIDVGTNSIKLLVADVRGHEVHPVHEESRQTRLGKGFYETHRLQPESIAHTAEAVWEFSEIARDKLAASTRVIATSAARDAVNPDDLTKSIERACGLKTEIISGVREAEWGFLGVATNPELAGHPLLIVDVGGGSAEFILGHGSKMDFAQSFPLGTVRLMEKFPHASRPTKKEFEAAYEWLDIFLRAEIRPQLEPALKQEPGPILLVGTGGTTSILARVAGRMDRFDRDKIDRTTLSFESVRAQRKLFWSLPLSERKAIPGMSKERADVILAGVLIYEMVMAEFGFKQLRVSTRGLRFAAVMT